MLETISDRVKCLLYRLPKARDNDMYLFAVYCENFLHTTDLKELKDYKTNIFESIRRSRAKIQADCPELRPSKEVQSARDKKQEEYFNYSIS